MNKKLQRQLQLAGLLKESKVQPLPFDLVREGNDDKTYVISRENSKYYIKSANTKENLQESDFEYLGGLGNKSKHSCKSFESATSKLNLMFESERRSGEESIDLLSEKRFVLKQPKLKKKEVSLDTEKDTDFNFGDEEETSGGDEDFDFGDTEGGDSEGDEDFDFGDTEGGDSEGDEDFDFGDEEETSDGGDEGDFDFGDVEGGDSEEETSDGEFSLEDDESGVTGDNVKDIQSLTGKLGQKVRATEDLSSDMQKWVVKSVISALDMDTLEDSDKQDILNSLNGDDLDESEEDYHEEGYNEEESSEDRGGEKYDRNELLFDADEGIVDEDNDDRARQVSNTVERFNGEKTSPEEFDNIRSALAMDEDDEDDFILRASDLKRPSESPRLQQQPNPEYRPDPAMNKRTGRRNATLQQRENPKFESDRDYFRESIIKEDHLEEKMESDYQLETYLDIENIIRSYDLTLGWCHSDSDTDTIYLDLKDGEEKLTKILIDYDGSVEIGEMIGDKFIGEPLDDLSEIDELLGIMNNELHEDMMENEETPVKTPTRTKPGTTPSRRDSPFSPPEPNEDTKPKAAEKDAPVKTPTRTKPGTTPSRRDKPFNPPSPTEDPAPKAGGDNDVEFGY